VTPDALQPLEGFYRAAGLALPPFQTARPEQMPEPYRSLLCHDSDMTSVLEAFAGQRLVLQVLQAHEAPEGLRRKVVLIGEDEPVLAELGAIRIYVDRIQDPAARERIREGHRPLGGILHEFGIEHRCEVGAFFSVTSDGLLSDAMGMSIDGKLYGRYNRLYDGADLLIAEVTEILPPHLEEVGERP